MTGLSSIIRLSPVIYDQGGFKRVCEFCGTATKVKQRNSAKLLGCLSFCVVVGWLVGWLVG